MNQNKSVQEIYAPDGICFGCGVKNEKGLRIRSFEEDGVLVCEWQAEEHHQAFPGMLNGGIIGFSPGLPLQLGGNHAFDERAGTESSPLHCNR